MNKDRYNSEYVHNSERDEYGNWKFSYDKREKEPFTLPYIDYNDELYKGRILSFTKAEERNLFKKETLKYLKYMTRDNVYQCIYDNDTDSFYIETWKFDEGHDNFYQNYIRVKELIPSVFNKTIKKLQIKNKLKDNNSGTRDTFAGGVFQIWGQHVLKVNSMNSTYGRYITPKGSNKYYSRINVTIPSGV